MKIYTPISDLDLVTLETKLKYNLYVNDETVSVDDVGSIIAKLRQVEDELLKSSTKAIELEKRVLFLEDEKKQIADTFRNMQSMLETEINKKFFSMIPNKEDVEASSIEEGGSQEEGFEIIPGGNSSTELNNSEQNEK